MKPLFHLHKSIKELFHAANLEPSKVFEWFNASKLSLNEDRTKVPQSFRKRGNAIENSVTGHNRKRNKTNQFS